MVGTSYRRNCLPQKTYTVPTKQVNEGEEVNDTEGIEDPCERLGEAVFPCKAMTLLERSPLPCFNLHFVTRQWIPAGAHHFQRASGVHSEKELKPISSPAVLPWPLPSPPWAVSKHRYSPWRGAPHSLWSSALATRATRSWQVCVYPPHLYPMCLTFLSYKLNNKINRLTDIFLK